MAISQPFSGTLATVSTTELSCVSGSSTLQNNTTAGIYQLMLDLSAMAAGDSFRIRIKEKVIAGGTQRNIEDVTLSGAQADPNYVTPSLLLVNGWDMTIVRVGGTDRAVPYSIRMVA
jgi:hypothetical protein